MTAVELCEAFVAGPCAGIRVVRSCLKGASRCPDLTPLASDSVPPMLARETWLRQATAVKEPLEPLAEDVTKVAEICSREALTRWSLFIMLNDVAQRVDVDRIYINLCLELRCFCNGRDDG